MSTTKKELLERGSHAINSAMETFFGNLGYLVGQWPRFTILCCLIFTMGCGLGFSKFVMISDPEDLFTPAQAIVIDDERWSTWFEQEIPQGVPEEGRRELRSWTDTHIGLEGGGLVRGRSSSNGMERQLEMYGFEADHFLINYGQDHAYSRLNRATGEELQQRRGLLDYREHDFINEHECQYDNVMMFRPETASSTDFLEDNAKNMRLMIEIQLNVIDHFGLDKVCWDLDSQPRIFGVGSCWQWDLARFDEDVDRIGTLSKCIKHDQYLEANFMAGVEKDRTTGRLTQLLGIFTSMNMNIAQIEIEAVDRYIMSHESDQVHLGTIGWASINNAIFGALIHDMPFIFGPVIILTVYVSHIFYRKGNDSHMSLAFTGIANVFMAVISGIGLTLSWGTGFTALHVCAVYITLGIGIDDAFIITAAVYGTQKQLRKFGDEEIRRRVKIGMSKCGPSILLTSLTDFFAFFSNVSSNVFAIRNFSMVAAIMVLIDFIFQVTFFVSTLVMDMQRQEANRYDILCCFKRKNRKGGVRVIDDGLGLGLSTMG